MSDGKSKIRFFDYTLESVCTVYVLLHVHIANVVQKLKVKKASISEINLALLQCQENLVEATFFCWSLTTVIYCTCMQPPLSYEALIQCTMRLYVSLKMQGVLVISSLSPSSPLQPCVGALSGVAGVFPPCAVLYTPGFHPSL